MEPDFPGLIQNVVAGDRVAAARLVQQYEPEVRRIVRFRLKDSQLRRVFDSTDICQSVFGQFFCLAGLGRFEISSPNQLVKLLAKMASNRIIDRYRSETSQRRLQGEKRQRQVFSASGEAIDTRAFPDDEVEQQELLLLVRQRLSNEAKRISELKTSGKTWLEVAEILGQSPQSLRKKLERECAQIFEELGIRCDG